MHARSAQNLSKHAHAGALNRSGGLSEEGRECARMGLHCTPPTSIGRRLRDSAEEYYRSHPSCAKCLSTHSTRQIFAALAQFPQLRKLLQMQTRSTAPTAFARAD